MDKEIEPGDRIKLVAVFNDPEPFMVGEKGTVVGVRGYALGCDHWKHLLVDWDNYPGRAYNLVSPPDLVLVNKRKEHDGGCGHSTFEP